MNKIDAIIIGIISITIAVFITINVLIPVSDIDNTHVTQNNNLDIVVLIGQSNTAYWSVSTTMVDDANADIKLPISNCYYFGTSGAPCGSLTIDFDMCDIYPMVDNNKWVIGGLEVGIASIISNYSGDNVLIVNAGVSGENIDYFTPDNTGGQRLINMLDRVMSCIDPGYNIVKTAWIWNQGENDKTTSFTHYIAEFNKINDMFFNLGYNKGYIVETRAVNGVNSTVAQSRIVNSIDNINWGSRSTNTFTIDNGYMNEDDIHYNQHGRNVVGIDCGNAIINNIDISDINNSAYNKIIGLIPIIVLVAVVIGAIGLLLGVKI